MKYVVAFLLLLALAASDTALAGVTARPLDPRRTVLGTPFRKFRHLVLERSDSRTQTHYYSNTQENLQVGPYRVTGISYGFFKGQLCSLEMRVMGDANCKGLYEMLLADYGSGQPGVALKKSEQWIDPQVTVTYTEGPQGFATVVISSQTLLREQRLAERKPAIYQRA